MSKHHDPQTTNNDTTKSVNEFNELPWYRKLWEKYQRTAAFWYLWLPLAVLLSADKVYAFANEIDWAQIADFSPVNIAVTAILAAHYVSHFWHDLAHSFDLYREIGTYVWLRCQKIFLMKNRKRKPPKYWL